MTLPGLETAMSASPASARYTLLSIVLHWAMLALIAGAYLTAELQEEGARRDATFQTLHYSLGLSVLLLVWLRVLARLIWPAPPSIERGWRHGLSRITHGALYVLMIGMPLVGW